MGLLRRLPAVAESFRHSCSHSFRFSLYARLWTTYGADAVQGGAARVDVDPKARVGHSQQGQCQLEHV